MKNIEVKIIKNIQPGFISEWQRLWDESENGHFFNSPKWFLICKKVFKIRTFLIFAAYRGSKLKAVFPLINSRKFGVRVLVSPGERYLEKSTLLISDKEKLMINNFFTEIAKHGNIFFSEVNEELAGQLAKSRRNYLISTISINPYIEMKLDPHRYLSKKQKSKISNKIKKVEDSIKHGHYRDNFNKHLKTVFDVEAKSAKRLKGKEMFSKSEARELYKNLINIAPKNVLIDVLYYQDKPVVTMLGLIYKGKYLAYHTSYVEEFKKLLPGKMLLYKLLTKLSEVNTRLIDFSRGHNVFKKEFTPFYTLQYDVYYSKNPFVRAWWEGINSVRRLKQILIRNDRSLDDDYLFKIYKPRHIREPKKQLFPKLI